MRNKQGNVIGTEFDDDESGRVSTSIVPSNFFSDNLSVNFFRE